MNILQIFYLFIFILAKSFKNNLNLVSNFQNLALIFLFQSPWFKFQIIERNFFFFEKFLDIGFILISFVFNQNIV
jgi:hypothetical protein